MRRLIRRVTPEEERTIEFGYYPTFIHYTGGSKDGTEEPYSSSTDVKNYLYHGADGKWYGLVRRDNRRFERSSGTYEYYTHTDYEWFIDTIDGDTCTTRKIVAPEGINEFYAIGMSGKWIMCVTGNGSKVWRIDTTNIANIEEGPGIIYNSSHVWTYIVDDDIVISGWYFLNGEPRLYVRDTPEMNYIVWGEISNYKV